jgi:hypothetical protein
METDSGDDAVSANPTRSGRISQAKAKVASAIKTLSTKRTRKPRTIESSPSKESLLNVTNFNLSS